MPKILDVIGKRFGKYVIIERVPGQGRKKGRYKAACDCGKIVIRELKDITCNETGCMSCRSKIKKKNFKANAKRKLVAEMTVAEIKLLPWSWHVRNYYIKIKEAI